MINYVPNNIYQAMYIKHSEKRKLTKTSNGLGLFVFAYFMIMFATQLLVEILYLPKQLSSGVDMNALYVELIF